MAEVVVGTTSSNAGCGDSAAEIWWCGYRGRRMAGDADALESETSREWDRSGSRRGMGVGGAESSVEDFRMFGNFRSSRGGHILILKREVSFGTRKK